MNVSIWPLTAFVAFGAALVLVPAPRWREFWPTALVGGVLLTFLNQYLFGEVLGAWVHLHPSQNVLGIPVWLPLAWGFETLIFVHYLPRGSLPRVAYVLAFGLGAALLVALYLSLGVRPLLRGWSVFAAFLLGVFSHLAVVGVHEVFAGARARLS